MTLDKKTAFITGGAKGLGRAYAERFLEEGANVFFGDVDATLGKATEQELQEKHGKDRVTFSSFDVTNGEQFKEAVDKAVSQFGNIDVFINNAGILNEGIWEKMIAINVTAVVRGSQLAMEHMRKDKGGKGGRLINISSIAGLYPIESMPVYCGTKHAVRSFTTSLTLIPGIESDMGIEIAVLCPDAANTDLMTKIDEKKVPGYDDETKEHINSRMISVPMVVDGLFSLLKREESINGAVFLVTKDGSSFQDMMPEDLGSEWPIPEPAT